MVKFKPHIIYVYELIESEYINGTVYSHGFSSLGIPVAAMVHPLRTKQAFDITGSQLIEPMNVFIEVSDIEKFKPNFKVNFNGDDYYVVVPPERFSHNLPSDHARFVMAKGVMEGAE